MESVGSLPFSHESFTGPYPEPNESSPYYVIIFIKIRSNSVKWGLRYHGVAHSGVADGGDGLQKWRQVALLNEQ
jgi:hypothetical protein